MLARLIYLMQRFPLREDVPLCMGDVNHPRWTYAMTKMHGESAFIHSAECV